MIYKSWTQIIASSEFKNLSRVNREGCQYVLERDGEGIAVECFNELLTPDHSKPLSIEEK